jgi:glycogen synthase
MMNRISAALSLYDDKPKWTGLVKRVMAVDFSWEKSAKTYGALYDSLMR